MHLDLPIEQFVRRKGVAFQFAFAVEAREVLPQHEAGGTAARGLRSHPAGGRTPSVPLAIVTGDQEGKLHEANHFPRRRGHGLLG